MNGWSTGNLLRHDRAVLFELTLTAPHYADDRTHVAELAVGLRFCDTPFEFAALRASLAGCPTEPIFKRGHTFLQHVRSIWCFPNPFPPWPFLKEL